MRKRIIFDSWPVTLHLLSAADRPVRIPVEKRTRAMWTWVREPWFAQRLVAEGKRFNARGNRTSSVLFSTSCPSSFWNIFFSALPASRQSGSVLKCESGGRGGQWWHSCCCTKVFWDFLSMIYHLVVFVTIRFTERDYNSCMKAE